ncbi:MAG: MgtC/SapB family protein [Nanoarchaeota archaeon]|nr:MgtC/SapB family protein [Nanoarchaeota archaeon]
METWEIILRFAIVFVLSFIYGYQRQKNHKPVGFGTFILVATGACALAITASEMNLDHSVALLGAIVTGIGFLGAGALVRGSDRIFGFTTAASIWIFAIFGMIMGLGKYKEGFIIYAAIWITILFDNYLEDHAIGSYRKRLTIECDVFVNKDDIANILAKYSTGITLMNITLNKKDKHIVLNYLIEGPRKDINPLLRELYKEKWCSSVRFGETTI